MDYPLSSQNWFCRTFGHRYRRYTDRGGTERRTCSLDGHTIPPWPTVPQSRADYDGWAARGRPKDAAGNWLKG